MIMADPNFDKNEVTTRPLLSLRGTERSGETKQSPAGLGDCFVAKNAPRSDMG